MTVTTPAASDVATLTVDGTTYEFPIVVGS